MPSSMRLSMSDQEQEMDFFYKTPVKNFYIEKNGKKIQLSANEIVTMFQLSRGRSAKQISSILSVSTRTVQYYIEQLKIKLDCYNKGQLADILDKNPIIKEDLLYNKFAVL